MNKTDHETLKALCKSIITRLENQKMIEFSPQKRLEIAELVFNSIKKEVYTDEDFHRMTLEMIGDKSDNLNDAHFTETEQYKTARSMVKKKHGEHELNGFYYQNSIKSVAENIRTFLMEDSSIDDVFESDEELEKNIVTIIKKFNPRNLH